MVSKNTARKRQDRLVSIVKPSGFSQAAQKVYASIVDINPDDAGTVFFAKKIGQAITVYDQGIMFPRQLVAGYLLFGSTAAPLNELANALAEAWIGTRPDNGPSYIEIDCAVYQSTHPLALAKILGPSEEGGLPPLLSPESINTPDHMARGAGETKAVSEFANTIDFEPLALVDSIAKTDFVKQVQTLVGALHQSLFEAFEPHRLVLVFSNVERATPDMIGLMRSVINGGVVQLHNGKYIDLNPAIVLFLCHDNWDILRRNSSMGFVLPQSLSARTEHYRKTREFLLAHSYLGSFVLDIGDNLIVLGERTEISQKQLIDDALDAITTKLAELDLMVDFPDDFHAALLKETRDSILSAFVSTRLNSRLLAMVWYPLANLVSNQLLNKGDHLVFSQVDNETHIQLTKREPLGTVVMPSDMGLITQNTSSGWTSIVPVDTPVLEEAKQRIGLLIESAAVLEAEIEKQLKLKKVSMQPKAPQSGT